MRSSVLDAHTGPVRFLRLPTVVGVKHKPALPTDNNAFHAWSRRREAAPRIYPNNQVSPACRDAKASLHPQTVRAQTDDETRFYVGWSTPRADALCGI